MKFNKQWKDKFAKMEDLVLQFECMVEEKPSFEAFLVELKQKYEAMEEFKKTYQKSQIGLDTILKKVGVFDKHVQLHRQTS